MRRRIILFGGLFFLVSLLVMAVQVGSVQAEEDPCFYVKDCLVPAPTLVVPDSDFSSYADRLVITGLSWNETLVDIYIDGVYNGRAELNLDDSGIANFAYETFLPLTPGEHSIYTVARNLNARERSIESSKISFSIIARLIVLEEVERVVEPEVVAEPIDETIYEEKEEIIVENEEVGKESLEDEEVVSVNTEGDSSSVSVAPEQEGDVSVGEGLPAASLRERQWPADAGRGQGGQIATGAWEEDKTMVSDLQKTVDRDQIIDEFFSEDAEIFAEQRDVREKQNRQIGLAMLGVIIVISIVWVIISSKGLLADSESSHNDSGGDEKIVVRREPSVVKPLPKKDKTEDVMDDELDKLV